MLVASRARLRTGSFAPRLGPLQAPGAPSRQGSVLALAVIDRHCARDGGEVLELLEIGGGMHSPV